MINTIEQLYDMLLTFEFLVKERGDRHSGVYSAIILEYHDAYKRFL